MPAGTVPAQQEAPSSSVLRIAVPTLLLDGRRPADAFLHRHRKIVIHADIVQVRGCYGLCGRTVEIVARRIEADDAAIDVSGTPSIDFDDAHAEPSLDGTSLDPNGKAGAPGERGHDGGSVAIRAGEIVGSLALVANGSRGGKSQRGGNGAKPATPAAARDGSFTRRSPPAGPFGATEVQGWAGWRVQIAFGEPGAPALPGGDAGPPGRPGDGGAGGSVDLRYVEAPAVPLRLIADGGPPGPAGACGQPGPASDPGPGGRNRVYLPGSILGPGSEDYAFSVIASGAPPRAASGAPSRIGNVAKPPPPAAAGQKGATAARQVTTDEIAGACDDRYLEIVFQGAATDEAHGNLERARARYQWVAALARNTSNEAGAQLRDEASARIQTLQRLREQETRPAPA